MSSRHEESSKASADRHVLGTSLLLNIFLAMGLGVGGILADSSGLVANALDNTSDAVVYGISYLAVSRGVQWKARAAQASGWSLLVLCGAVLIDVVRRFMGESEPVSVVMIWSTVAAATINIGCLKILHRRRQGSVNLRAAWTFSINDLVSNLGVLVAAILVNWTSQSWPDLVAGVAIAVVAAKGGIEILNDARNTLRQCASELEQPQNASEHTN